MSFEPLLVRILDANANRVREGLRTAEDYVRFMIGDLQQAGRIKLLRQTLTEILHGVEGLERSLLESRNVAADPMRPDNWKDVLRRIERETPRDVAQRGMKRAQEGLRVLEENLRGFQIDAAERIARLRYLAYESEQWIVCASKASQVLQSSNVYVLLTSKLCRKQDPLAVAEAVLKGGVRLLQLREKELSDARLLDLAKNINKLCVEYEAAFFLNDRIDLAVYCRANGAHLGQEDVAPAEARQLCGRRLMLGLSTHSARQARDAVEGDQADYIGVGAMYETQTKAATVLGGLKLMEEVAALDLKTPVFAIGGITLQRLPELKAAGARRVALSTAIIAADDPERAARLFVEAMG